MQMKFKLSSILWIFCFTVSIAWILLLPIYADYATQPPLIEPFSLRTHEKIEKLVYTPVAGTYAMDILFARDKDIETMGRIVGDMGVCAVGANKPCSQGDTAIIRWQIKSLDNSIDISEDAVARDANSYSRNEISRSISKVYLPSGYYQLSVEVVSSTDDLSSLTSKITLHLRPKDSGSPAIGYIWWGSIFRILLAIPLAILSCIMLSLQLYSTTRRS